MKRIYLAMGMLTCISVALFGQDRIVLKFTSSVPLDSISIENLVNNNYRVIKDTDSIVYLFPSEETVDTTTTSGIFSERLTGPVVYPNPFRGRTCVEFQSDHSSRCVLSIYDLSGNLVTGIDVITDPGMQRFSVALDSPGMYVSRIMNNDKVYSSLMVNTGGESFDPVVNYAGSGRPHADVQEMQQEIDQEDQKKVFLARQQDGRKSFPSDAAIDSTSSPGDLLRLTGHSGDAVDVIYDYLASDSTYAFTFSEYAQGVYLQLTDTLLHASDTIRCFITTEGYHFACDTGEIIFSHDSLLLRPVTHGGTLRPVYTWEIENPDEWIIDTNRISSGVLLPISYSADTSRILLKDIANSLSTEFVLIMDPDDFVGPGIVIGEIKNDNTLDEISGMAASVKNPGGYWVHNDSGDEARIYLIDTDGYIICTVNIDTDFTDNRDWEDICVGPGPVDGETYIYIGEIGDQNKKYDNKYIFRIAEPEINMETRGQKMNIAREAVSTITFDYFYGPRDAEILMIDPLTRDLYIVTKREEKVQVFPIPYPQNYEEKILIKKSSVFLPFRMTNGGDISADGKEILIKNLDTVFYWKLQEGETILDALAREARKLPYTKEPQGEAIAWKRDGSGYLTVSEEKDNITPKIYLYKRKW